jgi:hypothetical protein
MRHRKAEKMNKSLAGLKREIKTAYRRMRRAQLLMKCLVQNEMARQEKKIKPRGD